MFLLSKGVPYDIAFGTDEIFRVAGCIVLGEIEGGKFNWATMAFEDPD